MAVDPLLEEREREEEEEEKILCHAQPEEPEEPATPERPEAPEEEPEPPRRPEEEPVLCMARPEEAPVLCMARPEEEEVEVEVEIEEAVRIEPPAGLAERWSAMAGDAAEGEFERLWSELTAFLRACASSGEPLRPPSRRVDDLWHQFILFTREYHAFCERIGGYVHHVPDVPAGA